MMAIIAMTDKDYLKKKGFCGEPLFTLKRFAFQRTVLQTLQTLCVI